MTSKRLLVVLLAIELVSAFWVRWPLTTSTIRSSIDYQVGQVVIASENWRRDGALARHFVPSRSIDQELPEWSYRDTYWRDYLSQPPLAYMLHYWASRLFDRVDPIVVAKLLAQAQIAAGILVSGALLFDVFGFGATLAGLTFLIWGQPFLVWFIDGYYSTTPAMVCQLILVAWSMSFVRRELSDASPSVWSTRGRDLLVVGAVAWLGVFSEWIALLGNAIAVALFLTFAVAVHRDRARRLKAYAVAAAVAIGSAAAELTTVVLFGSKVGYGFYWASFMNRVRFRTGQATGVWTYTQPLVRQMERAWPPAMLAVLAVMALMVFSYAAISLLTDRQSGRRAEAVRILFALCLAFGGAVVYCYRLKNLVEIHWWFTGTWAIGWAMTISAFMVVMRQLLRDIRPILSAAGYPIACAVVVVGAVAWNLSFVDLHLSLERLTVDVYRMLGAKLPHDGYPLIVVDLPHLFTGDDYPYATAYVRRPIVQFNSLADPSNRSGNLLFKLLTHEDATPALRERYHAAGDLFYVLYDGSSRECAFSHIDIEQVDVVPIRVCAVPAASALANPAGIWSSIKVTSGDHRIVTVNQRRL